MLSGEALKQARQQKKLSQAEVASAIHSTRQAISRWENGRGYPDMDNIVALAKLYDLPYAYFFGDTTITNLNEITTEDAGGPRYPISEILSGGLVLSTILLFVLWHFFHSDIFLFMGLAFGVGFNIQLVYFGIKGFKEIIKKED